MKLAKAVANSADQLVLEAGARFWVYLSPKNETAATITQWRVTFTIGSGSGVDVPLNPGQSAKVELVASGDILKVRVTYATYLTGCAALNYTSEYNGHHFWGADIQAIMIAGGIPTNIQSTEDITLSFFSNSKVTVSTNDPNKLLQTIRTNRLVRPIGVE